VLGFSDWTKWYSSERCLFWGILNRSLNTLSGIKIKTTFLMGDYNEWIFFLVMILSLVVLKVFLIFWNEKSASCFELDTSHVNIIIKI